MEIVRLFDIPFASKEKYGVIPDFLCRKIKGEGWKKYSTDEAIEHITLLSYAFLKMGVQKGDKIAVISSNRPEWNFLDHAIQSVGAIMCPIYPTISDSEYYYILNFAGIRFLFSEGRELFNRLNEVIKNVLTIEERFTFANLDDGYRHLNDLYEIGKANPQPEKLAEIRASISEDDVATIIFTSGTTGEPKGVMLTHKNILGNVKGLEGIPPTVSPSKGLSFLPLCHVYERAVNYHYQLFGYSCYYAENVATVAADSAEIKPNIMVAVPRVIEKVYDKMYTAGTSMPWIQKRIYYWALKLACHYNPYKKKFLYQSRRKVADILVYRKLRAVLGSQVNCIISGGAAIQEKLLRFMNGIGILTLEGYGLSETSPVVAVNRHSIESQRYGTVGRAMPGVEVRIAEDNEILVRGYCVMKGYYNDEVATTEVIDEDHWFHTGDLGSIDKDGFLKITGRKKSLFKTSFGKFVNPIVLEDKFKESPFIDQIMVVGDGQKFAAAIITLDWEFMRGWWKRHKLGKFPKDQQEVIEHKDVHRRLGKEVKKYNKNFGHHEQIFRFKLLPDIWSPETGELSQTLKVRRKYVEPKYKEVIGKLFE
ncbi:MAG: long-chain fatty acid--CoA ligase [Bacteroidales bacterium]|nr:long-chain fatty acid--CoA ligase [Bacteroidales bacterium]